MVKENKKARVKVEKVIKIFSDVLYVNDLNFEIDETDLMIMVGPSG